MSLPLNHEHLCSSPGWSGGQGVGLGLHLPSVQAGPFRGSGPTFANSTRSLAEDFAKPLHAACEQRSGRVHNETFNEDSRCKRQLRWPASRRVIPATSRVHGSVEVLQSVLLLLLSSLISSVLLISIIISGQLMAAQGAGVCLA